MSDIAKVKMVNGELVEMTAEDIAQRELDAKMPVLGAAPEPKEEKPDAKRRAK